MKRNPGSIAFVPIAFVSITLIFLLTACATPESEQLRKDNSDLKSQLEVVTQERDALKSQIDSIRKALEAPSLTADPSSTDPSKSDPSSTDPNTADPSTRGSKSDAMPSEVSPSTPDSSGPNTTPQTPVAPEKPIAPDQPVTPESVAPLPEAGTTVTTSPLYKYAATIVQAATNYRLNSQQNPPSECSLGYSAGSNTVERSIQVKRCEVQALENNQYRVRVEGIDGSVVIVP
jgi:hypothetical protein